VGAPDQAALLKSADPKLAANKKLVFDMWRAIIQGAHTELAPKYFTEGYIQHNPNVATGRDAMVAYMKSTRPVRTIEPTITFPVIAIMAEGDLVMVATVSYSPDPEAPDRKYAGTHFDMFRIENGKIAEHWDSVAKSAAALHFDPNTQNKP
jgi:predicted SnoaL-like aldol condensation-catalyzing enzyme